MNDYYKDIIRLEDEISKILSKDEKTVHFEYINDTEVRSWTYNSKTSEIFLLESVVGEDYVECLTEILNYVKGIELKKSYNSYTVTWERVGRRERNISYFYCTDVIEVIEKFFKNKDKALYQIFDIKMNPIS